MYSRHAAYGLDLHAAFALPGMRPGCAPELPSLRLEHCSPAEIDSLWSGRGELPAWTGRLGDGSNLTIEVGVDEDVLFTYGDRARFLLEPGGERLACAPLQAGLHWQQALLGRVLPNVAILRGYEALHASSVDSPHGVVAIAAPSGMGKTTLALELLARGWPLFADDVLTLGEGPRPGEALAHPGTPHMNVAARPPGGLATGEIGTTLGILAGERWIAVADSSEHSRPVRMVCLLERGPGLALAAQPLSESPLPLAPYMLGLPGDAAREGSRFARYADLMSRATLIRLTCDLTASPSDLADLIDQALAEHTAPLAGALR